MKFKKEIEDIVFFGMLFLLLVVIATPQVASLSIKDDFSDQLKAYYDFENTSMVDRSGNTGDGTNNGVSFSTGLIGNAGTFVAASKDNVGLPNPMDLTWDNGFTFQMWIKGANIKTGNQVYFRNGVENTYMGHDLPSAGQVGFYIKQSSDFVIGFDDGNLSTSNWNHVVFVYDNSSGMKIYHDGVLLDSNSHTGGLQTNAGARSDIGFFPSDFYYFDGEMDEVGFWNKPLSQSNITALYNSGAGVGYDSTGPPDNNPTVELINPDNFFSSNTTQTIDLVCYGSDDINFTNMSLYLNGVLNETNSSGINNTNYTFTKTLDIGKYNWTCSGQDNSSQTTTPAVRYFTFYEFKFWPSNLNNSLIAYYDLNNNSLTDISGISGDGTTFFGTTINTNAGVINNSLFVDEPFQDGADGFQVDNITTNEGTWTVSSWFRTNNTDVGAQHYFIFDSYNGSAPHRINQLMGGGRFHTDIDGPDYIFTNDSSELTDNQWHNLVSVLNSSENKLYLYVDGISVANYSNVAYSNIQINTAIGTSYSGVAMGDWEGDIDEVIVWDRALNFSEVTDYYNNGFPPYYFNQEPITQTNVSIGQGSLPDNIKLIVSPILVNFNCSNMFTSNGNLTNVSLFVNSVAVNTTLNPANNSNQVFSNYYEDGTYDWYCEVYNNESESATTDIRTFSIDSQNPLVNITSPANNTVITQFNQSFNLEWTAEDANLDDCWYEEYREYEDSDLTTNTGTQGAIYYNLNTNTWSGSGDFGLETLIPSGNKRITVSNALAVSSLNTIADCRGLTYSNILVYDPVTNLNDYFCLIDEYNRTTLFQIRTATQYNWTYLSNPVNCALNTTTLNYPTTNPDSVRYLFFANDTFGNAAMDSTTLLLSNQTPIITITSPLTNYGTLVGGDLLDLTFTVVNDTILNDCWYEYNGANNTITCSDNFNDTFSYVADQNNLTVYVNDTLGHLNSSFRNWNIEVVGINYTYSDPVIELDTQTIDFYGIVNGTVISANLIYNGTAYSADVLDAGGGVTRVSSTFQTPNFDSETNVTFYMSIGLLSGTSVNFTTQTQTVQVLELGDCVSYSNLLLNMSLYDERTLLPITGTIETTISILDSTGNFELNNASTNSTGSSTSTVCSNINLSATNNLYSAEIRYYQFNENTSSYNYVPEFYHIQKAQTSNLPTEIELYNLNSNESTEFTIFYRDNDYIARPNVLLQIQRRYVDEGVFRVTEIPITSSEGSAVAHFDLNNYKYRIVVTLDGEVLNVFENPAIACENELTSTCTLTLDGLGDAQPYKDSATIDDLYYEVRINGSIITVDFTVPSGEPKAVNVVMTQSSPFADNQQLCNTTVLSSSNTISCTVNETIGDSQVLIEVRSGGFLSQSKAYFQEQLGQYYDLNNYFIGALLLMILAGMFVSSPKIMVGTGIFGIALLGLLFLINGSSIGLVLGAISWFIIAAVVIILKMTKKDET